MSLNIRYVHRDEHDSKKWREALRAGMEIYRVKNNGEIPSTCTLLACTASEFLSLKDDHKLALIFIDPQIPSEVRSQIESRISTLEPKPHVVWFAFAFREEESSEVIAGLIEQFFNHIGVKTGDHVFVPSVQVLRVLMRVYSRDVISKKDGEHLSFLRVSGMIEENPNYEDPEYEDPEYGVFRLTKKAHFWLNEVCQIPLPVQTVTWSIPGK